MAVVKVESNTDVLTAAKTRIKNIWDSAPKIYLAFSAGKDSLCVSNLIYELILSGEIDPKKLTVYFIDEEGLYKSMVDAAMRWRRKFMAVGAEFRWYCLPFKQVCTLDSLSATESWITWEPGKEDVWMRTPPPFAIVKSEFLHYAGEMNYQTFCSRAFADGITLIGLRACESFTRIDSIAASANYRGTKKFYPIYDWSDSDVWLYIKERNLEFPDIYIRLYEAGVTRRNLRLSAFFGDKTTQGLRWVAETDPPFWEKIQKRMPNAYLVLLYWDSEMFARSSKKRRELEDDKPQQDYKELVKDMLFKNTDKYRIAHDTLKTLPRWRRLYIKSDGMALPKHYKRMYEVILNGDPKGRDYRSLQASIFADYGERVKREEGR